jgi:hypothetical protein
VGGGSSDTTRDWSETGWVGRRATGRQAEYPRSSGVRGVTREPERKYPVPLASQSTIHAPSLRVSVPVRSSNVIVRSAVRGATVTDTSFASTVLQGKGPGWGGGVSGWKIARSYTASHRTNGHQGTNASQCTQSRVDDVVHSSI